MLLQVLPRGNATEQDWEKPGRRVDPYFVWFDRTVQKTESIKTDTRVELLVELPEPIDLRRKGLSYLKDKCWQTRFHLEDGPTSKEDFPRFLTGTIPLGATKALREEVQKESGRWVERFELASARFLPAAAVDKLLLWGRNQSKLNTVSSWWPQSQLKAGNSTLKPKNIGSAATSGTAKAGPPMVVVVDDFCGLGHVQQRPHLRTLWHQGKGRTAPQPGSKEPESTEPEDARFWDYAASGKPPTRPLPPASKDADEHYGAILDFSPQGGGSRLPTGDELLVHRLTNYQHPISHWSHGSAVVHAIAGGRATASLPPHMPEVDGSNLAIPPSNIHFVQLPSRAVLDTSGGSLAGFALDAMHRAVRTAKQHGHASVIVNLSYGTHSGPHDGSSTLERAMLDLLNVYDGTNGNPALHIVLPAGNTHLARCHGQGTLPGGTAADRKQKLHWKVLPDDDTDSFLEIWFNSVNTLEAEVEVKLTAPDGTELGTVSRGQAFEWSETDSTLPNNRLLRAAVIFPISPAQSERGTLALVALAPTMRRARYGVDERYKALEGSSPSDPGVPRVAMEAPAGVWTIELINKGPSAATFHAWVQRDDAAPGRARSSKGYRGRQSYLLDGEDPSPVSPRFTLNGIATASHACRRLWVVGAMDRAGHLSRYSAAGPSRGLGNRFEGPDVVMTVDNSRNDPGRLVGGVLSGSRLRLSGTSIGAAVFTRMLNHALTVGGPTWPINWCPGPMETPPGPPIAGEPELALPVHRGDAAELKLRQLDQLVLPSQNLDKCKPPNSEVCAKGKT